MRLSPRPWLRHTLLFCQCASGLRVQGKGTERVAEFPFCQCTLGLSMQGKATERVAEFPLSMHIRPARAGERNRACGWIPILSMHIRPERAGERNRACGWMKERGIQSGPTVELLRCTQRKCKSKCPHTHNLYWTKMEVNAHTIHSLHNTKMEVNAHKTHNMH